MLPCFNSLLALLCVMLLQKPTTTFAAHVAVFSRYDTLPPTAQEDLTLDLDVRAMVGKTALASEDGLDEAENIYTLASDGGGDDTKTLQSLSTNLDFAEFDLFRTFEWFYGSSIPDYADKWMMSAIHNETMAPGIGEDADFGKLDAEGRSVAVRWGVVTLNVWMAAVSFLEEAVNDVCETQGQSQTNWDQAFALYTGSLVEEDVPSQGGYMLYGLAESQCASFGTCKENQEAPVNTEMIKLFNDGKDLLKQFSGSSNCDGSQLDPVLERMKALLAVPLIQSSLRLMYQLDLIGDERHDVQGETAAFGAALAPIISFCSEGSARLIHNDMIPGKGPSASFEVVKDAVERQYKCLGITCADVGGLTTLDGKNYLDRAEACGGVTPVNGAAGNQDAPVSGSGGGDGVGPGAAVVISIVVVAFVVGVLCCFFKRRAANKGGKAADTGDANGGDTTGAPEGSDVPAETENMFA